MCLLISPPLLADEEAVRSWHDRSGFFSIEAEIIGVARNGNSPKIQLKKSDGSTIEVPYALFSDDDQSFAVSWYRQQQAQPKRPSSPKLPRVDDRVKIKSGSRWYKGKIVEMDGERFKFSYDGYSSNWDEWRRADQIRWEDDSPVIPGGPADANADENKTASSPSVKVAKVEHNSPTSPAKKLVPGKRGLPKVGDRVKIKWGNSWWKGVIEEVDGERFRFDYDGWDSYPDEWRTADQLRWEDDTAVIPGSAAEPSQQPKPTPAPSVAKRVAPTVPKPTKPTIDLSPYEQSTDTNSTFPAGLSPKETLAYLRQQTTEGNLQAFWNWVPDDFRGYITSQEHRDALKVLDRINGQGLGPAHFLKELVIVLRKQRSFVLKNPVVRLMLEDQATINALDRVYEPAVGLLDEFTQLIANIDGEVRGNNFDQSFRGRCDRMGQLIVTLLAAAPPDEIDAFWNRIVVTEQAGGGTLTLVYPDGQRKSYPLVRINGRWIPRPLAESLLLLPKSHQEKVAEIESLSKAALEGRLMGAGMAQGVKDGSYMSMAEQFQAAAAAKTQAEFDAAIQQALIALQVGGMLGR